MAYVDMAKMSFDEVTKSVSDTTEAIKDILASTSLLQTTIPFNKHYYVQRN
jgi:hypothetical protein